MGVEGKGHVCAEKLTTGNDTGEVRTCNIGIECWEKCGKQDGWCEWCKDGDGDGLCCRQGYEGNGCNGKMGEKYKHTCIQDPANLPPTTSTTTELTTTPEWSSTTESSYPTNSWSLVGEKQECRGEEEYIGRFETVEECGEACGGVATMFIFGTNDFGKNRCNRKGCKCICEVEAAYDGTCDVKKHRGYRLYRYDTWGGTDDYTDTDVGIENEGQECWWNCGGQEGHCWWCGVEGMCCRQGWVGNGCDGKIGGPNNHQCAKAPGGGSTGADKTCEDLNTWGLCMDVFADWCYVDWMKIDCQKLCKQC